VLETGWSEHDLHRFYRLPARGKVNVSWLEKETELFKASEVLKNAASISREMFHVEHSGREAGFFWKWPRKTGL
jgi:hypothetical protein